LCNLSSIAGLEQQEEIVQIKIRTIEHMEETIKACTGTIENQEYIIASQEEKITLQNLLITEFESVDIQQKKQQGKISDFIDISTPSRNTKCYDEKDKSTQNHNSSEKNILANSMTIKNTAIPDNQITLLQKALQETEDAQYKKAEKKYTILDECNKTIMKNAAIISTLKEKIQQYDILQATKETIITENYAIIELKRKNYNNKKDIGKENPTVIETVQVRTIEKQKHQETKQHNEEREKMTKKVKKSN
jgi:hypothetical protein